MTDIAKIESNVFFFSHAAFSLISMMFLFFIPYFCAWNWIAECFREVRSWTWEQCSRLSQRLRRHSQPSTTADYWSTYWDSTPGRRGETSSWHTCTKRLCENVIFFFTIFWKQHSCKYDNICPFVSKCYECHCQENDFQQSSEISFVSLLRHS